MPDKIASVCPRCRRPKIGRCLACAPPRKQEGPAYGRRWRERVRGPFLREHPTCCLCGAASAVADHHPHTRRELIDQGVPNPDDVAYLRPLCTSCHGQHGRRTSRT